MVWERQEDPWEWQDGARASDGQYVRRAYDAAESSECPVRHRPLRFQTSGRCHSHAALFRDAPFLPDLYRSLRADERNRYHIPILIRSSHAEVVVPIHWDVWTNFQADCEEIKLLYDFKKDRNEYGFHHSHRSFLRVRQSDVRHDDDIWAIFFDALYNITPIIGFYSIVRLQGSAAHKYRFLPVCSLLGKQIMFFLYKLS